MPQLEGILSLQGFCHFINEYLPPQPFGINVSTLKTGPSGLSQPLSNILSNK